MSHEERFVDLETRISFQEDAIHKISDAVYQQRKQIDAIEERLERIETFIKTLAPLLNAQSHEETPPPHY